MRWSMSTDHGRHRAGGTTLRERRAVLGSAIAMVCALAVGLYVFVVSPRAAPSAHPGVSSSALASGAGVPLAPGSGVDGGQRTPAGLPPVPLQPPPGALDFAALDASVEAQIGIALAPVGRPNEITALGGWSSGPAWSTIKVPLSIALLRQTGGQTVTDNVRAAITQSDNDAAQSIWEELGAHQTAADKVSAVLADAGETVVVNPDVTRPGFSAFGQTPWSLADQVRFLAYSACEPGNEAVIDLMGDIVSGQRWGLGSFNGARFKGGWGPGADGRYLVRQYGLIPGPSGDVAVAIAAVANSGAFGDGTAVLNRVSGWLAEHLSELPAGQCGQAG